jgi:hypothetical protein
MRVSVPLRIISTDSTTLGEPPTCGTVEVPEIQCMGVVCLPRREEHGQYRDQRSEGANLRRAVSDSCCLQKTCKRAVERVNSMAIQHQSRNWRIGLCHVLEELAQWARCSRAARLLAVDVVHGGVHPHAEREAVVYP